MRTKATIGVTVIACAAFAAGCSYSGDTSGFKARVVPSKDELTRQMAQIKANPKMPAGIKAMALRNLEKQLPTAQ